MSDRNELTQRLNAAFVAWTIAEPVSPSEAMSNGTVRGLRVEIMSILGLPVDL
jgi:hypothetical protein